MRWALGRCLGHILFFSLLDTIGNVWPDNRLCLAIIVLKDNCYLA
jgi:hypothetical protein